MVLSDAYATPQEYRAAHSAQSADDDDAIERDLVAISRHIDKVTGRNNGFNIDPTPVDLADLVASVYPSPSGSRSGMFLGSSYGAVGYSPPNGWAESENPWKGSGMSRILTIDDHVSIHSVKIDENRTGSFSQTLSATDYELLPRNAPNRPEPQPYRQIQLTEWGTQFAWLPGARIQVTGIRGWPAVPSAIVSACIELTAIFRVESVRATNRINEMNQVLSTSRAAQSIVDSLIRAYSRPEAVFA